MGGETRFAYFPAATVSDGTATAVSVQATSDPTLTQAGGQFHMPKSKKLCLQLTLLVGNVGSSMSAAPVFLASGIALHLVHCKIV